MAHSPFPGMDPYLEASWGDVRASVLVYGSDALNSLLPDDLLARIDHREWIDDDIIRDRFIKISERDGRLITTIELFGPWDKQPGPIRDRLLNDQAERATSGVNQVEIDLRRGGERRPLFDGLVPDPDQSTYLASIRRARNPSEPEVFRIALPDRLPILPIPLHDGEPDCPFALQPLVDLAYERGRYHHTNYAVDPDPPLTGEDVAWADGLLRGRGLR